MDLTEGPIVSVVIPAHNEEAGLAALLARLLDGAGPGEFDVVVVANACTDRTAGVARDAGVRVVETETPGKANALRLGDEAARVFPRVYADADILLDAAGVRALAEAARRPGVLACAPRPVLDLSGTGPVARRVHRAHEALVEPSRGLAGTGVYVLTEEAHARVFPLPDGLLADDGWVHATFGPDERVVVPEAASVVRPARTVRAHLRRRVRVRLGNRQLAELGRPVTASRLGPSDLLRLVRARRVGTVEAACYLAVLALDKALARMRRGRPVSWGTDASSRHS
ncbi:glycosyltransferase [Actinomadura logoneensis]|uniref:glycosyltransferase n=1 Tax=Actinomadura logoneensis TaxID=2293572 RepID=UPI001F21DC30|nr:glycosyltransferase [Actinomadura logoneensis]